MSPQVPKTHVPFPMKQLFSRQLSLPKQNICGGLHLNQLLSQSVWSWYGCFLSSETGRIRFRRVRFQTPNSVSFFGAHWVPGSELSEFLSAYYLCVKANSPSCSQNSPSLPQNSVRLSEFSSPKQYSRNSIPPVSYKSWQALPLSWWLSGVDGPPAVAYFLRSASNFALRSQAGAWFGFNRQWRGASH